MESEEATPRCWHMLALHNAVCSVQMPEKLSLWKMAAPCASALVALPVQSPGCQVCGVHCAVWIGATRLRKGHCCFIYQPPSHKP